MAASSPTRTGPEQHLSTNATNSSSPFTSPSASTSLQSPPLTLDLPSLTTVTSSVSAATAFRNPSTNGSTSSRTNSSSSSSFSASASSSNSSLLDDDWLEAGMVTPQQPGSPLSPTSRVRPRRDSNLDQDPDELDYTYRTPPPRAPFTHPPSPPKPGLGQYSPVRDPSQLKQYATYLASNPLWIFHSAQLSGAGISQNLQQYASFSTPYDEQMQPQPRKPLTSIAGSSRCLWPPNSTFLTTSSQIKDEAYNHRSLESSSSSLSQQEKNSERIAISASAATSAALLTFSNCKGNNISSHKNHSRSDSFKDTGDSMQELQPRRKARRMMDGPYFKERNHLMVASHVQKLIQEAVEDGVGELDLSNLELNDLPPDIRDLNYAIIYSERGSFSLSKNRLKLFLSSNQFTTVPMDVFSLQNLSVLSLRNNNIEVIPPEIGQLHNLVELSLGGNLLKYLPSQIVLLPKLHILTIHPNPFLKPRPEVAVGETSVRLLTPEVAPAAALPEHVAVVNTSQSFDTGHTAMAISTTASVTTATPLSTQQQAHLPLGLNTNQSSLLSPPVSPPEFAFLNDVEMELDSLQETGPSATTGGPSLLDSGVNSSIGIDNLMEMEDMDLALRSDALTEDTTVSDEDSWTFPPHEVTRSRFPSLLVLAGNAILNHLEEQQEQAKKKRRSTLQHQRDDNEYQISERLRKDSKVSVEEGKEGVISSGFLESIMAKDPDSRPSTMQHQQKSQYVLTEETLHSYLTPFLHSMITKARASRRCAGCQKLFLKPCRIMLVWQEVLGQSQVPIQWKGCGIKRCPGIPSSMWSPPISPLSSRGSTSSSLPSSQQSTEVSFLAGAAEMEQETVTDTSA